MPYQHTGTARRKRITITRGDEPSRDFMLTSDFTDPSTNTYYAAITDKQLALMDDTDYYTRRNAFIRFVYSQVDGLEADCPDLTQGSVEYDPVSCPLNTIIDEAAWDNPSQ